MKFKKGKLDEPQNEIGKNKKYLIKNLAKNEVRSEGSSKTAVRTLPGN